MFKKPLKNKYSTLKLQLLILLVFSATVINGFFFFHLMKQNKASLLQISLNERTALLTRQILGTIKDAEMGQRGYILTGRKKYLIPYTNAIKLLPGIQQTLTRLLKDKFSEAEVRHMDSLNIKLAAKQAELQKLIQLKDQGRENMVLDIINTDIGENDLNKIRSSCNLLLNSFYKNIRQDEQNISETLVNREISVILFSVLVITAVIIMRIKIINRDKKNARMFEAIQLQNLKLIRQQQELKNLSVDFSSRNAELEHFTHIISHDLRGPLTNMVSLIEILDDEEYSGESNAAFKMLKKSSVGLFHKLDDLIILLQNKKGGTLLKETVILSQLLAEVKANYKMEIERSGTVIEADFVESDEALFVKIYMQSILQNLISNAIKYRDRNRKNRITLKTYKDQDTLKLVVKDNGKGINMDKYGKEIFGLFKTFHHGDDSHGIGLYLVKKQISEMDGHITIDSEVGIGTTFSITIPA